MTDKQIIIDGIDVSGCIYYEDGKCLSGEMIQCNCKNVAVCYYKEYKRKEQECEELKGISMKKCPKCGEVYLNSVGMEAFNQLDQLKAQLLDQEAETLKAGGIIHKLEKTLTEIKEIAEHCIIQDICTFCDYSDRCYIEDAEIPTYDVCKLILQKISEVEDVRN